MRRDQLESLDVPVGAVYMLEPVSTYLSGGSNLRLMRGIETVWR